MPISTLQAKTVSGLCQEPGKIRTPFRNPDWRAGVETWIDEGFASNEHSPEVSPKGEIATLVQLYSQDRETILSTDGSVDEQPPPLRTEPQKFGGPERDKKDSRVKFKRCSQDRALTRVNHGGGTHLLRGNNENGSVAQVRAHGSTSDQKTFRHHRSNLNPAALEFAPKVGPIKNAFFDLSGAADGNRCVQRLNPAACEFVPRRDFARDSAMDAFFDFEGAAGSIGDSQQLRLASPVPSLDHDLTTVASDDTIKPARLSGNDPGLKPIEQESGENTEPADVWGWGTGCLDKNTTCGYCNSYGYGYGYGSVYNYSCISPGLFEPYGPYYWQFDPSKDFLPEMPMRGLTYVNRSPDSPPNVDAGPSLYMHANPHIHNTTTAYTQPHNPSHYPPLIPWRSNSSGSSTIILPAPVLKQNLDGLTLASPFKSPPEGSAPIFKTTGRRRRRRQWWNRGDQKAKDEAAREWAKREEEARELEVRREAWMGR